MGCLLIHLLSPNTFVPHIVGPDAAFRHVVLAGAGGFVAASSKPNVTIAIDGVHSACQYLAQIDGLDALHGFDICFLFLAIMFLLENVFRIFSRCKVTTNFEKTYIIKV